MRTVITGGAGFIGRALTQVLLERAHRDDEIIIVDSLGRHGESDSFQTLKQDRRVRFVQTDLTRAAALDDLPVADRVYHLAAIVGVDNVVADPARVIWANTAVTAHVFQWFANSAPPSARLVFASTSEIYSGAALAGMSLPVPTPEDVPAVISDPRNPRFSYALSKLWGEMYGRFLGDATGAFIASVRYHNVYGPEMGHSHVIPQVIRRVLKRETPFQLIGAADTRSFCWVADAAEATRQVMEAPQLQSGQVVNIGDADGEISIGRLYEMIFEQLGWRPGELITHPSPSGSVPRRCPDTTLLSQLTGYLPTTSLGDGLKRTVDWYRDNTK